MRIAICDDCLKEATKIYEYTQDFFRTFPTYLSNQTSLQDSLILDTFSNMPDLLAEDTPYDLYLLDVMMPSMSGIEGAKRLRQLQENATIIFITSSLEAAIDGYKVQAAGFLLKPLDYTSFCDTLTQVLSQMSPKEDVLSILYDRVPLKLSLSQVIAFENRLHQVYIYLVDGRVLSIHQSLSNLAKQLSGYSYFLRCHQSYMINLYFAKNLVDTTFEMENGLIVPISRAYFKEAKTAYYRHMLA